MGWCVLGAVTLMVLLMGGNQALKALQAASIAGALPFTFVILAMIVGLVKSLRKDSESYIANEDQCEEDDRKRGCRSVLMIGSDDRLRRSDS